MYSRESEHVGCSPTRLHPFSILAETKPALLNINCTDPLGRSALLMAIDNENLEMIDTLLQHKVITNSGTFLSTTRFDRPRSDAQQERHYGEGEEYLPCEEYLSRMSMRHRGVLGYNYV